MNILNLFERCISIEYTHTEEDGSYAYEIIDDVLYIYFQKSNGENDWKNNLDFPIKSYNGRFVHRGFLRVWESLSHKIDEILQKEKYSNLVITGYSHGGALAVLCYEHVFSFYPNLKGKFLGYGFGSPRVFWGRVNKCLWNNFYVVRNINDIVTHLPPKILGYTHVGNLISIGKANKYSKIDAHREENISKELKIYLFTNPEQCDIIFEK